ncbi:MAG: V-type ATP synthase subunit I, partial [Planctomycetota bacterium]|nr:V-type ATP synthase subunit I [Planctomycetota bacterium]
ALHRCGAVHVTDLRTRAGDEAWKDLVTRQETADQTIDEQLARARQAIAFMSRFSQEKGKQAAPFVQTTRKEYESVVKDFDCRSAVERLNAIEKEYIELETALARNKLNRDHLAPWVNLDIPLRELAPTRSVDIVMGVVATPKLVQLDLGLRAVTPLFHLAIVDQTEGLSRVIVFFAREHESNVAEVLKQVGIERVSFKELGKVEGTPRVLVARLDADSAATVKRRREIESEMRESTSLRDKLVIAAEHLRFLSERKRIEDCLARTPQSFMIEGWIRTADFARVKDSLQVMREVELIKLEPLKDEVPPTEYDNNRLVTPFEFLTDLYSRPTHQEPDPTPLFAPFITLYFAICLTDAGYGLVLAIVSFLLVKKALRGRAIKKLFTILALGGTLTVAVGIVTGGYFGLAFDQFPESLSFLVRARKAVLLLDPMVNPLAFWVVTLALGFLQINMGLFIKIYKQARSGQLLDGLIDQGAWVLFLNCVVLFGLAWGGVLPSLWLWIGAVGAGLGAVIILFFHGRMHRNPGVRLVAGAYSLYGITGFLGDVLSYSRLFAIGLSTGILAMVVNKLAGIAIDMLPYVGWVVGIALLLIGHTFNLVINTLGGFVHSTRLQFVEYFSKFYDGGGEVFSPFREELDRVVLVDATA